MGNRKSARRRSPSFELSAGVLCLDFVNTLDDRPSGEPKELLEQYMDLARFAEDTRILEPTQVDRLLGLSYAAPEQAQRALRAAIQLREALYAVFWAAMHKKPAPSAVMTTLNQFVQLASQHSHLVETRGHFEWRFDPMTGDLESPLWAIARSAAELLASDHLAFVRACSSKTCQWLFLDTSKNHRRRWCDMKLCGNRAKFRRFYNRQKKGA
jgi:predicted RNA-binding Zn ribbon-like protein